MKYETLTPHHIRVLEMRLNGMKAYEIAEKFNVSENAIQQIFATINLRLKIPRIHDLLVEHYGKYQEERSTLNQKEKET